jgi:uncharacterized phage-associated protein
MASEPVEAWQYGPVFTCLYRALRRFGAGEVLGKIEARDKVNDPQMREVINAVWQTYGSLSGPQLSHLTHKPGTPWARSFRQAFDGTIIPDQLIKDHYRNLILGQSDGGA